MVIESELVDGSMYLVLPVPFRIGGGKVFVEGQAGNGLDRWADNFSKVIVAAPVIPEALISNLSGFVWRDLDTLEHRDRITFQALPWAFSPVSFLKAMSSTREAIANSIRASEHLQFAIGGLWGDWAAVAGLEAIRQKRRFAIHTDRVEHEVIRKTKQTLPPVRRLKATVEIPFMERYHRHLIEHCSLGLWHGDDCFQAYSPWCVQNLLVHDVHTKQSDLIDEDTLSRKLQDIQSNDTFNLCYTGRIDPMKAPLEWLRAIATARDMGANLRATWYGEGSLLSEARAEASRLKLDAIVNYPGFVAGREQLLRHVRAAHAMVFTHITPESPRNLLESLVSGTPILGYDNAYAANLLHERGGGILVPIHDYETLGRIIAEVANDRQKLAAITGEAAKNGRRFTDSAVFEERSNAIKQFA